MIRVHGDVGNLIANNNGNVKPGRRENTPSEIDEERSTEVFIIESFQMTEASPRRCWRRPPSAATGRIWCGAVANQTLRTRLCQSRESVICGKIFVRFGLTQEQLERMREFCEPPEEREYNRKMRLAQVRSRLFCNKAGTSPADEASSGAEWSPAWSGATWRSFRQSRQSSRNALMITWTFAPDCFP